MCDAWYANMVNGDLNRVVFLDIRKAFDSVNLNILLRKMKEQLGVSNIELKWFESYISNKEQVCFVNGTMSTSRNLVCGVPQGPTLRPPLYLLYINDLPSNLENTIPCLYADDTQIFSSANDYAHLVSSLNCDLNNISQWPKQNKLHHSSKTKLIFVGSKHNVHKINDDIPVMLNGQLIPRVTSISCLGATRDETLSWDEHIHAIFKKVAAGTGTLGRIKPFIPVNMLQSIYGALILLRLLFSPLGHL